MACSLTCSSCFGYHVSFENCCGLSLKVCPDLQNDHNIFIMLFLVQLCKITLLDFKTDFRNMCEFYLCCAMNAMVHKTVLGRSPLNSRATRETWFFRLRARWGPQMVRSANNDLQIIHEVKTRGVF